MIRFVAYLLASQVACAALGVVSNGVINHSLARSARGDYAELVTWAAILSTAFGLSIGLVAFHFANRELYHYARGQLAGSVLVLWALSSAFLLIATTAVVTLLDTGSANLRSRLWLVLAVAVFTSGVAFLDALLKIGQSFRLVAVCNAAAALLILGCVAGLAASGALDVPLLLAASAGLQLALMIAYLALMLRENSQWRPLGVSWKLVGRLLSGGAKIHLATVSGLLYVRVDQIIVYNIAGADQTAYYAVAVSIVMQTLLIPTAVAQVLSARLIDVEGAHEARMSLEVSRITVALFAICLAALYALAGPLVFAYAGGSYAPTVRLIRALLPGILFFSIPHLLSPYWLKQGHFLLASASAVALLGLNLALNYVWIPAHGAMGAAWATDATYFAGLIMSLAIFYGLSRHNPLQLFIPHRSDLERLRQACSALLARGAASPVRSA
ncbi:MAG TPA: polysaccharide biosynthesis C-terminal domain-containing protein [Chloroflexota bacterium]